MHRAEIRTALADAETVAAALRPDNTTEMDTRIDDGAIVTTIERETASGLRSTVDDYVVNLAVARRTVQHVEQTHDPTTNGHTSRP